MSTVKTHGNVNYRELELPNAPSENPNKHIQELSWMFWSLKREKLIHSHKYRNEAFVVTVKETGLRLEVRNRKNLVASRVSKNYPADSVSKEELDGWRAVRRVGTRA